jgi:histidine triad (HIT) family protein
MSCLFCKIIAGDISSRKLYEDDELFAFEDINPQAPLHALVIPRRHIATLNDLTSSEDALLGSMVRRAAAIAQERGFDESG